MPDPSFGDRLGMAVMEPGSLVMERKMLLGIKERAERLNAERTAAERRTQPADATAPGFRSR